MHLSSAGVRTVCIARQDLARDLALSGISLVVADGEPLVVRPEVREELGEPVDVLVIAVKAHQLDEALEQIDPAAVEDAVVVPLLNGLEHMDVLRERLGPRVAAGSISRFEAYRVGRVQIIQTTPSAVITIGSSDVPLDVLEKTAALLDRGAFEVLVDGSEKQVLWDKAARLAVLAAATVRIAALGRGVARRPRLAGPAGSRAHGDVCDCGCRRGHARALHPVGHHRGDGLRPHDLHGARPRGRPPFRAGRDRGLGRPCRGTTPSSVSCALGALRPGNRAGFVSSAIAFVPARSGSERVPGKNVRPLAGHPLLAYAIETALQSDVFERVVVSTDSEEIADVAHWYGADVPFLRPTEYATSTSPDIEWLRDTLLRLDETYELFAIVRATNPFRGPAAVKRGLEQLLATPEADSLRAVELVKQHPGKMWLIGDDARTMWPLLDQSELEVAWHAGQYQALPPVYVQNSALEIAWSRVVTETGTREGRVVAPFHTEGYEGFNVDDEDDWERAERLLASGVVTLPTIGRAAYGSG